MSKYIDAEKLKAEINERLHCNGSFDECGDTAWDYDQGMVAAYNYVLSSIESLQQEQLDGLHFTPLNRLIQKIPSEKWDDSTNNYAKKLRDCLIKEGYRKDAEVLQGYISYMNGNNVPMATMDEQEQPEVDLEKEIDLDDEITKYWKDISSIYGAVGKEITRFDFDDACKYFYELGKNEK